MKSNIRTDFDNIALAFPEHDVPNHNNRYHSLMLTYLPLRRQRALDLGCGTGDFLKLLAAQFDSVTGIDFSHEMINRAARRLAGQSNVQLLETDVLDWQPVDGGFDLIVSIATFHHLPIGLMLGRCRQWLNPGGVLVIQDLCRPSTIVDYTLASLSIPANFLARLLLGKYVNKNPALQCAWDRHGHNERYHSLAHIRQEACRVLPGARVRNLLYWRYLLPWNKNE